MSDLLVIGAGTLGMLVARRWKTLNPAAKINLKFRSDNSERNSALVQEGFTVVSKESGEGVRAGVVVFCAPPTGNNDYAEDILASVTDHWSPSDPGSVFVFTSAGSVYQENSGAEVDEMSATVRTERSGKLLDGEQHVVAGGGCVVRLGGLYSGEQGAHNFWCGGGAETKEFSSKGNGLINLVHYEDAAEAVIKCLQNPDKVRGEIFLVSDGVPVSRRDIASAAANSPRYSQSSGNVKFTGGEDVDGKKYNSSKIRNATGWAPKYPSFADFMKSH